MDVLPLSLVSRVFSFTTTPTFNNLLQSNPRWVFDLEWGQCYCLDVLSIECAEVKTGMFKWCYPFCRFRFVVSSFDDIPFFRSVFKRNKQYTPDDIELRGEIMVTVFMLSCLKALRDSPIQ